MHKTHIAQKIEFAVTTTNRFYPINYNLLSNKLQYSKKHILAINFLSTDGRQKKFFFASLQSVYK